MDAGRKQELEDKVYAGERLSRADGAALADCDELAWLGRLAQHRRSGDQVTFIGNRRLAVTGDMTVDEALARAAELRDAGLAELHIEVAGPDARPWEFQPLLLRALAAMLPGVGLRGFGAATVAGWESRSGRPAGELLDDLIDAGLTALPGDAAPVAGAGGLSWADWSRIHRLAHERGLPTAAGMRYGQVAQPADRVDHLLRLRDLQDGTSGFEVFVPYQDPGGPGAPAESLRTFAVSRLLLDNVPHLACRWPAYGLPLAQLALNFGVDDLDGPVAQLGTGQPGDAGTPAVIARTELVELIGDGGYQAVERDARYRTVRAYDPPVPQAQRRAEPQRVWA